MGVNDYYYYISCKSLKQALADGLSPDSKWQQVSSSLQDFSQYSGRS